MKVNLYQKINTIIGLLFLIVLIWLAQRFANLQNCSLEPAGKVALLNKFYNNFIDYSFIICISSWLLANLLAVQSRSLYYLIMPMLLVIIATIMMAYFDDSIFDFVKHNNLSTGSFSIAYILAGIIILVAIVFLEINYFVLHSYFQRQ